MAHCLRHNLEELIYSRPPIRFGLFLPCNQQIIATKQLALTIGATKTMNIDIFNYSHYAFTGAVVHSVTGNLILGMGAALVQAKRITFKMKTDGMINAPTTVENATPAPAPDPRSITVKLKPKRSTIKLTAGDRKLEIVDHPISFHFKCDSFSYRRD
jgi:hypothetical protein